MADCHIGAWREPRLQELNSKAFAKAVDMCIEKKVDFILISGDLFNTSLPGIEWLKNVVKKLKQLKSKDISVYVIAGSHDFSPSGKTMLDVLEEAGLFINVVKGEVVDEKLKLHFTVDKKTGAKITGMLGKKGTLEKRYYENLLRENLENETGFKIFMFHSALTEYKPQSLEQMDSNPVSMLPKNFDYYAGGHVHYVFQKREKDFGLIAYPGPLFPNSFKELEELGQGGFYIYEDGKLEFEPVQVINTHHIKIQCVSPEHANTELGKAVKGHEFVNTLVTVRLFGNLESGRISDIRFKEFFKALYGRGAFFVMKNTYGLAAKDMEEMKTQAASVKEIEDSAIKEHLGKVFGEKEKEFAAKLMELLSAEKEEGERVADFEKRIRGEAEKIFGIG